jgi:error-prone DNA polymerase
VTTRTRLSATASYAPLWCKSNFSFLEGASGPDELVEQAHALGLPAVALTDRDGVYGIVRAHQKAEELGIPLIVGSEITTEDRSTIVLLATNREGYARLSALITRGRLRSAKGHSKVTWREVADHAEDLIALWGGEGSLLLGAADPAPVALMLKEAFSDRIYAMLTRHRRPEDADQEERLRLRARAYGLPTAAASEVLYHSPDRRMLQDVLTCVRHKTRLSEAGRTLKPNREHDLKAPSAFAALFQDDAASVARTLEVAARCRFSLREIRYRYPSEKLPSGMTSFEWLQHLVMEGARFRYGESIPAAATQLIEKELNVIGELDYCGYFLTMREIVEYCRGANILCQGRGSAANSVVCYCLGVTAVDPVRMDLLFERFLSKERAEPPDIDLDIEHERREEVIQHVYEKYGRSHAAMVANVIRYRPKSAVRDVGRALGLTETTLARASKMLSSWGPLDPEALTRSGIECSPETLSHLVRLAGELQGFPRHLSIHPGGFLLGHEPVDSLVPVENATMEKRTVIQWDKDDVEAIGLFKVDLLGLGALTHLHRCFDLLRLHHGVDFTMATVPPDDPATFEMASRGDTVGVFQIESRAQMAMLPRLRPKNYYDLVVQVSIVRPGPITGGMVHPYLRRRNGEEPVEYPHPCLEPVLKKTLGVPLFQEQVMRLAVVAADYTPGEADQLRRDMAAWKKTGRMEHHRERLTTRMIEKGISAEFAERVYQQILGFGDYGFPESHAASFALISYVGAWLKCHYPAEFACSLLNSLPMGFYSAATIIEDAKRHGVPFAPIDVTKSQWNATLSPAAGPLTILMGGRFVKGLAAAEWAHLEEARMVRPFSSMEDFVARTRFSRRQLGFLAEAGAFASLNPDRRSSLWEVKGLAAGEAPPMNLGGEAPAYFTELTAFERVSWDYQRKGHSTEAHLLVPLRGELTRLGLPTARAISAMRDGKRVRYAGIVICRQRPGTASGVVFMTLEDETGFVNVVVWKDVFRDHSTLARTTSFLGITGRLQAKDGVTHLIAESFWTPEVAMEPSTVSSRDFH